MNYLAIVIAAVAAWLAGAGWYMALGKTWTAALGTTPEKMAQAGQRPAAFLPYVYAFIAELLMAWILAGLLGHIGALTVRGGIISAAFCWARLRHHDHGGEQHLRRTRRAPVADRRRPLAASCWC